MAGAPVPPDKPEPPVEPNVVKLGQLMAVLAQDPKHRPKILGLIKEGAPDIPIPELDVARATEAKVESEIKPLREENKRLTDRLGAIEQSINKRTWQEEHGVDDEELVAVSAFAKEKKIGDPTVALDYWRQSELGRPRGSASSAHLNEESRKELYKNPKQWYEREANKILSESRRRRSA